MKTSKSVSAFIADREAATFRKAKADALEMPLTRRQVLETLHERIDEITDWLRKYSDGKFKRPDTDIADWRQQREMLIHIHNRWSDPEGWAADTSRRPTTSDVMVFLEKRARSAHWWLQTFSAGPKRHNDAAIEKKRRQLAVFAQISGRWHEPVETSDAA